MDQVMLDVRDLTCGYGGTAVLRDVSLSVRRNEFVGIIGPNGSGKTTFLRAVTRVIPVTGGIVRVNGRETAGLRARDLAKTVAVVSNTGGSDARMSVEEFVLLGRLPFRPGLRFLEDASDMRIAEEAMVLTGIGGLKNRHVDSLSTGEKQLAFVARAIAQEPQLLLLDELTSHLDISHQVKVLDLLRVLNATKGIVVMVIMHDLNLASEYCDRLLLFHKGSLRADGAPEAVLTYQMLEEVYGTLVVVLKNPISSKPCVFLVSGEERARASKNSATVTQERGKEDQ